MLLILGLFTAGCMQEAPPAEPEISQEAGEETTQPEATQPAAQEEVAIEPSGAIATNSLYLFNESGRIGIGVMSSLRDLDIEPIKEDGFFTVTVFDSEGNIVLQKDVEPSEKEENETSVTLRIYEDELKNDTLNILNEFTYSNGTKAKGSEVSLIAFPNPYTPDFEGSRTYLGFEIRKEDVSLHLSRVRIVKGHPTKFILGLAGKPDQKFSISEAVFVSDGETYSDASYPLYDGGITPEIGYVPLVIEFDDLNDIGKMNILQVELTVEAGGFKKEHDCEFNFALD